MKSGVLRVFWQGFGRILAGPMTQFPFPSPKCLKGGKIARSSVRGSLRRSPTLRAPQAVIFSHATSPVARSQRHGGHFVRRFRRSYPHLWMCSSVHDVELPDPPSERLQAPSLEAEAAPASTSPVFLCHGIPVRERVGEPPVASRQTEAQQERPHWCRLREVAGASETPTVGRQRLR